MIQSISRSISYIPLKPRKATIAVQLKKNRVAANVQIPVTKTIIDDVFQDDIYFKPEPLIWTKNAAVRDVRRARDIKGVDVDFVRAAFMRNLTSRAPIVSNNDNFSASFFPKSHFLSYGRKSSTAALVCHTKGSNYNGVQRPDFVSKRSPNPMHYAVWRKFMSKALRRALFRSLSKETNQTATLSDFEGVFLFRVKRVETKKSVLQDQVLEVVRNAFHLKRKGYSNWVLESNRKVNLPMFNAERKRSLLPPLEDIPT